MPFFTYIPRFLAHALAISLTCVLLSPGMSRAQSDPARTTVDSYLAAQHKGDWKTMVGFFDPADLSELKRNFQAIFSKTPDQVDTTILRPSFFGVKKVTDLAGVDSVSYAAGVYAVMVQQAATLRTMMTTAENTVLGSVNEGSDMKHFVLRVKVMVQKENVSNVDMISVKKVGGQWRIVGKRNFEQLTSLFKRMIS